MFQQTESDLGGMFASENADAQKRGRRPEVYRAISRCMVRFVYSKSLKKCILNTTN